MASVWVVNGVGVPGSATGKGARHAIGFTHTFSKEPFNLLIPISTKNILKKKNVEL